MALIEGLHPPRVAFGTAARRGVKDFGAAARAPWQDARQ